MSAKNSKLYFVALIPTGDVLRKVRKLKEEVAERYESKAALKSPPHITLHMPFKFREDREDRIEEVLRKVAISFGSFTVFLPGFGAFPPKVIYVDVQKTEIMSNLRKELIKKMCEELKLENAGYKGQAFNPHMTIAYRDLKKSIFPEAWAYYRNLKFRESWECGSLILLKHNGKTWDIFRSVPFSGSKQLTFSLQ